MFQRFWRHWPSHVSCNNPPFFCLFQIKATSKGYQYIVILLCICACFQFVVSLTFRFLYGHFKVLLIFYNSHYKFNSFINSFIKILK